MSGHKILSIARGALGRLRRIATSQPSAPTGLLLDGRRPVIGIKISCESHGHDTPPVSARALAEIVKELESRGVVCLGFGNERALRAFDLGHWYPFLARIGGQLLDIVIVGRWHWDKRLKQHVLEVRVFNARIGTEILACHKRLVTHCRVDNLLGDRNTMVNEGIPHVTLILGIALDAVAEVSTLVEAQATT